MYARMGLGLLGVALSILASKSAQKSICIPSASIPATLVDSRTVHAGSVPTSLLVLQATPSLDVANLIHVRVVASVRRAT
jgi:hypothetical protein